LDCCFNSTTPATRWLRRLMRWGMRNNPFRHTAGRFIFTSPSCDLRFGVAIRTPKSYTATELAAAVAEMTGYHATAIWPDLNGFSGYDSISWKIDVQLLEEDI
jgi:hypothetical protein